MSAAKLEVSAQMLTQLYLQKKLMLKLQVCQCELNPEASAQPQMARPELLLLLLPRRIAQAALQTACHCLSLLLQLTLLQPLQRNW
jgi:hypothetical protein